MSWRRLQSVWKYVQEAGGVVPTLKDLTQQSLLRTDGKLVGKDAFGNKYFEDKTAPMFRDRWVVFAAKVPDPTTVPGEWHQWLHHVGDAAPASVVESEHKFFQSPHTRNTTGVVFTEPSETYTPHNFLFNKNFNKSYTHAPTIEEFVPKVKANNDNNNNNNNNNDK